jgi:Ni,Fe-hydrogenase III small subunit
MPVAVVALGAVAVGITGHALFVNGPVDDVTDLTEEVEDGPVAPEELPLVE